MILLTHIIIALASVAVSAYAFAKPSDGKLKISYLFAGGTFASGVVLIASGASLVHACMSGVTFLGLVSILNEFTRRKLNNTTV